MNKKIISTLFAITTISTITVADYQVRVYLDDQSIKFDVPNEITGSATLNPATINRGESSMLTWTYDYISTIDVTGDTQFSSKTNTGSIPLTPLKTSSYTVNVDNGKVQETKTLNLIVIQPTPLLTFNSNKLKIGEGESVQLSWNVDKAEEAILNNGIGSVSLNSSLVVYPLTNTTYTLKAIGYNQEKEDSKSISIDVINNSNINSFTSNKNKFTIGESATFNWSVNDSENLVLMPYGAVSKTATSQVVPLTSVGEFDYILTTTSFNNTQKSATLKINVYGEPVISAITGPTNVFINSPLTLSWTGSNVTSYKIKSNNASSGISTSDVDLGTASSRIITPAAAGTYTYTITATNEAGVDTTSNKSVVVEDDPTFTGFTVNGSANLSIAPSTAVTFAGSGFSDGSTLVGRNSDNSANAGLPNTSNATVGSSTYYAAATKTLNSVVRYSSLRSVVVTTVTPKICQAKNASYSWTYGQMGPQPNQVGTSIIWAGSSVYNAMGSPISQVDVGGFRYTNEGTNICRTPL